LKHNSSPQESVGVNYFRYPFIRYYTNRHCERIFTSEEFGELSAKPDFFIFFPYGDRATQMFLETLKRDYVPVFQCRSKAYPAVIFKRNGKHP
jgi:hypothetical protein